MISGEGIPDTIWVHFTRPVDFLEEAILKLISIEQRTVPAHIVEVNEETRTLKPPEKKEYLKTHGKMEKARDKEAGNSRTPAKYLLC